MATLPRCARKGCTQRVQVARYRYCSRECSRLAQRTTDPVPTDSIKDTGDTREITKVTGKRVKTLKDLIRICEIDTEQWTVDRWLANKWDMAGEPQYQVKVWLKRRVVQMATRAEVTALIAEAKRGIVRKFPPVPAPNRTGHALLIEINDAHFGKLAWAPETGYGHYDLKIAQERYYAALNALLARTANYQFEEIVLVFGNDLINSDNPQGTTNAGTPQNNDGRYHKTFAIVRDLQVQTIEHLRMLAPVKAIGVPGNHDKDTVWHLGDSLACWFHADKRVTIDNAPTQRKYHRFGNVMLMFLHGHEGKKPNYPLLMATEQKAMWSATTHHEIHTGHIHHERVNEYNGVKVYASPALCEPDLWHSENQFVGAAMGAQAVVYHATEGRICTATYTVTKAAA